MDKTNYTLFKNNKFGRYLVASRNIKAGELILAENPLLIGPPVTGFLICFNCCREIKRTAFVFCSGCNAAIICNGTCRGKFHTQEECQVFKTINIKGQYIVEHNQIIFPLRCLVLKTTNPKIWDKFMELEYHLDIRRNTTIWRRHQITVEEVLRSKYVISKEQVREELIQKICGILDVNTFEVRPPHSNLSITNPEKMCLRGLYIEAALMAHDCTGNTLLSVDDDFTLTVKASVDIPKNSSIFINYANVLQGTFDRQQHLREGKYFDCSCQRCNDPTELDTNISSLKCHKCSNGFVRIISPDDPKSDWICSYCGKKFLHSLVNIIVEEGKSFIQNIDQINLPNMDAFEKLQSKLLRTFHPNHYLLLDMEQNMIGRYSLLSPNINNLNKKINLCQHLLGIISIVEPGISRMKALTMYQLQSAMIDLAHKNYQEKQISLKQLLLNLKTAEDILAESLKYLFHEPLKSPEGKIAQAALSDLKVLRTSIGNIQNDLLITDTSSVVQTQKTEYVNGNLNQIEDCQDIKKKRNKKHKRHN